MCLATITYVYMQLCKYVLPFLVYMYILLINSAQFQILCSYTFLLLAAHSYVLLISIVLPI